MTVTENIQNDTTNGTANGTANGKADDTANGTANGTIPDISLALNPSDVESVPGLLKDIASTGNSFVAQEDRASRLQLLAQARQLVRALETPRETMLKNCWGEPGAYCAIAACMTIGVFPELAKDDGSPKKVSDLAKTLNCDEKLLGRLMRHLGTMAVIKETGPNEYKPTNFSTSLTIPVIGDGFPALAGGGMAAVYKFPAWLQKYGFKNPESTTEGPYQYAYDTHHNLFGYLMAHPPLGMQFNHHMGGYRQGRPSWMDPGFFPVEERLAAGADTAEGAALLVDLGGGHGHDINEFRRKHPDAPGRLILQDLPDVLAQITELDGKIERMGHDFLTEQPVKGARAYYMHSVLHDWSDETCLKILGRVKAAMRPGYSKVLINENVIPDAGAGWEATALDMMVMTLLSAEERTEKHWRSLVGRAGLKLVKIWSVENGSESLIECELP
ncbi:S-adenosyl-L-methionine-dependent methyltransferase [Lineolata rhizophorae]|uniref:S-adenosyl-L-methionine-dependent methyltransferase n=1 Tax=Lineolata rhizophorae TaxID=578093 RepID=A0A6A6NMX1_9PEZI|nr:S-adenosyl-L-methionine-dependent methyltransferase [Lineolata rhizophorae]